MFYDDGDSKINYDNNGDIYDVTKTKDIYRNCYWINFHLSMTWLIHMYS